MSVIRVSGGPTLPAGVLIPDEEWQQLRKLVDTLTPDHTDDTALNVIRGRLQESYNVAAVVSALIDSGCGGQSVPPKDLPAQIRSLGLARARAEQQARRFAGEIADLRDTLQDRLPTVFDTVLDEIADDVVRGICGEVTDTAAEMILEAGIRAYRIALRLVTDYDVRDRDGTRPVEIPPARTDPTEVRTLAEFERLFPGSNVKVAWHDDPEIRPHRFTVTIAPPSDFWQRDGATVTNTRAVTLNMWGVPLTVDHPAVIHIAERCGPLTGCDGSAGCKRAVVLRAFKDAFDVTPDEEMTDLGPMDFLITRTAEQLHKLVAQGCKREWVETVIDAGVEFARRQLIPGPADAGTT